MGLCSASLASLPQASQGTGTEAEMDKRLSRGTQGWELWGEWRAGRWVQSHYQEVLVLVRVFGNTSYPAAQHPLERQGTPKGEKVPLPSLPQESVVHCSAKPSAFGLLGGCPRSLSFGGSWCKAFLLTLLAPTAPQVPALSAPASHPCGLPGQLLAALAPRDGEGPSRNLDAIRGNQPKTPRQLLPQDYSQSAKDIRVIIQSLHF